jgi:hypothetical protein
MMLNRFTVQHLYLVAEELRSICDLDLNIEGKMLFHYFQRRFRQAPTERKVFPKRFYDIPIEKYADMIKYISAGEDFVSWRKLTIYFALLDAPLPTPQDLENLGKALRELSPIDAVGCDLITKAKMWFDSAVANDPRNGGGNGKLTPPVVTSSPTAMALDAFDRSYCIKELIFYICKDTLQVSLTHTYTRD